jgi:plasmid stabilization system protein ParE
MPAQIVWALSGLADLTGIVSTISADNPREAQRVAEQLKTGTRQLGQFPLSGKHYDWTPRGEVREWVVPPYRIFYRLTDDQQVVRILRVWHAARGLPEFTVD